MIGIVAPGIELHGIRKLLSRSLYVSQPNQTGGEVRTGCRGRRLEAHGLLQVLVRLLDVAHQPEHGAAVAHEIGIQ